MIGAVCSVKGVGSIAPEPRIMRQGSGWISAADGDSESSREISKGPCLVAPWVFDQFDVVQARNVCPGKKCRTVREPGLRYRPRTGRTIVQLKFCINVMDRI